MKNEQLLGILFILLFPMLKKIKIKELNVHYRNNRKERYNDWFLV